ncbi:MAG: ABC transporter ATP-binding protein [Clostridia bacterium]|nr:ABC transporter ATP-binding protein [Clostridia bacterium]
MIELGSSLFTFFGTRLLERAYNAMRGNMRTEVSGNVLRIKTEHIDANGTGVFTERLIRETANVVTGIDEMVNVVTEAFRLVSLLIAFFAVSKIMMVYELLLFVLYLMIVLAQSKKTNEDSRRLFAAREVYSGFIGEMVRAARDIKLLHCENSFLIKLNDIINTCTDRERESGNRKNLHFLARSQFVTWTDFIYLAILTVMMAKHGMPPATALILYNYNGKVFASTRAVAGAADAFYRLLLSSERVYQLMESSDFSRESFGERSLDAVNGDIELKNVRFAYHNKGYAPVSVIKNMDLHIPAGQSVALIGRSSCGKSTVLSLISRLYEPNGGTITLDGADISTLDQDTIRNGIGVVTQTPYLFSMSLRDNFRLVKSDVTDGEIVEVCKTACVHDDIMALPDGYDTVIGEGGSMLSGGQRQRIALARALLRDYPVIMLDEATSALDNETQATIRDAIENMHGKRTVVMIAHRLSTVVNCERLFYLENGKVLASGTHAELLERCPEYRRLYSEEAGAS